MNAKFAEIDQKLTDKANKTTVAQALHRKANKPELDAVLAKKVDFEDLQRILENKVDIGSFQNLVHTVEYKADKHEILQQNFSLQQQSLENTSSLDKAELERLYTALKTSMEEVDGRMSSHESQMSEIRNQLDAQVHKIHSMVSLQLQSKIQREDLESIVHELHAKVDFDKVQDLISQMKQEMVGQLATVKKEVKRKT